jgi:two-component system, NarL family, sensor histidine kinase BarA
MRTRIRRVLGRSRPHDIIALVSFDEPPELARLLEPADLDPLVAGARAAGIAVAIVDTKGVAVAGRPPEPAPVRREILCAGEPVGAVVAEAGGEAVAQIIASGVASAVHHAHARSLVSTVHQAAMEVSFAELSARNARLEHAVARMQEVDRLKTNFLATMSHELRTPLTSVIGYAEMLLEGLAGQLANDQREYVQTILGKADQLLQLISAVLEVSNLESGSLTLEAGSVDVAELARSVIDSYSVLAQRRGVTIDLDPGPRVVVGDRRKIRQIVQSLVSNAVKFTRDRGKVAINFRPGPLRPTEASSRPALHLVVHDSGIGISAEAVAHIFDPFYQVDSSSTREFGGTGLGLTLAKAYVEAHGGRLWVETSPGAGSTFVATLPVPDGDPR